MNTTPQGEQVSKSKKALTAFAIVGVLLVSALVINSVQSKTNLGAQAGFFSRLIDTIFGDRLGSMKRSPKDTSTFATDGFENGNAFFQTADGELIFNLDNIEGIQGLAIQPDASGVAYLPEEEDPTGLNSYIITFDADPIAVKTKEILESQGKEILPGEAHRETLKKDIQNIRPQLDSHKATIASEQNALLNKLSSRYGSASSLGTGEVKVYKQGGEEVRVRQLRTTLNAVTVSNVTPEEIEVLTKGVPHIKRIEKARPVQVNLLQTPDIINSIDLEEYFGANGAPITGEGTTIGIVDTGVDYTHQDFGSCSFLLEGGCKVAGGYDFINDDNDPMDDHGHGTHVAGTAAGNGYWTEANGDTNPLLGIAPDATIYAYKVLSSAGSGSNIVVVQGIEACADPDGDGFTDDHVTVCSLSLGSPGEDPLDPDALAADAAVDAGVIMTIAAGNDGPGAETIGSPGTSRKAITVGASCKPEDIGEDPNCFEEVASFSSRGPVIFTDEDGQEQVLNKPDIVSPGVNICAAQWGDWIDSKSCLGDGEHIAINGTSMATPTVAGLMALLAQAHPDKTVAELKETLMTTATDLGLPLEVQGQGLVDGVTALEGLGIPNSILSIEGLPFFVDDISASQTSSYAQQLTLENISEGVLNLTASRITNHAGVTMQFPQSFSINPGQTFDFDVVMNIDHMHAISGQNAKETIALTNGEETVNIVISRRTPRYLIPETDILNFGLFHESEETFTETLTVNVENRLNDVAQTYEVVVDPYDIQAQYQDNITVTTSVDQITLAPGGSGSVDITITANSTDANPLKNQFYRTDLKFVSATETIPVELEMFRGFGFDLYYGEEEPDYFIISGDKWQLTFYPNPQLENLLLRSTKAGPFNIYGLYNDDDGDFDRLTLISEFDVVLSADSGVPTYNLSKSKAEHRIENHYHGNTCSTRFIPETGFAGKTLSFIGGGQWAFEYSTFPDDMRFSMICGDLMPEENRILFSQIYLTEGLNQDFSLNDATADISNRFIYGFNNKEAGDNFFLGINLCNFRYFKHPGEVDSYYNMCSFWWNEGVSKLELSEGEAAVIEVRSLHTDTPETSSVPDYPGFRIYMAHSEQGPKDGMYLYTSANMFATSEKLYSWAPYSSGVLSTSESSTNAYEKSKINVVNDMFITIGTGPLVDTTMVKAYKDIFGFLGAELSSRTSMYRFADGATETKTLGNPDPGKAWYEFSRDGELVATSLVNIDNQPYFDIAGEYIPDEEGEMDSEDPNYGGPVVGEYSVAVDRISRFDGESQNGTFSSEFTFEIAEQAIDSAPPVIENIQLVANDLLQNHFDPASDAVLNLYVSPGYGIQNHNLDADENDAYEIDFIENDQITEVVLSAGDNPDILTVLPTPQMINGVYVADLSSLEATGTHKYFRLFLEDTAGNTTTYNFIVEVGTALIPDVVGDPALLETCERNAPTITPIGYVESQANGHTQTESFQIMVTNNDSAICDNTAIFLDAFETTPDFAIKKASFITSPDSVFGGVNLNLDPGQSQTKNLFYKNFGGAVDMNVPITIQVSSSETLVHSVDVEAYVTYGTPPVVEEDENLPDHCAADFNKDGQVSTADQLIFNTAYGTVNATYDLNGSGGPVNAQDLITFLSFYNQSGCPIETPPDDTEEDIYTNVKDDPEILISYEIDTENNNGSVVYQYEVIITNNGAQDKTNLVAYNIIPDPQLPYAEFIAATVPNLQVNLQTGALHLPIIEAGQTISVFITVTMPQ